MERKVALVRIEGDLGKGIRSAAEFVGLLDRLKPTSRVAIKPNLTYPYHKPGVTTSPAAIRETVRLLRDHTSHIAIVETDGGYGAWRATEAFAGHGIYQIGKEFEAEVVNLCDEPSQSICVQSGRGRYEIPLPTRLLHETDLFITMPVPKIHCMTGLTLSYKNQWGCVPDTMRLRRHHIFDNAIIAVNRALKPAVLGDGTWFLDRSGPMEGEPVRMDLVIAASNPGSFDRYVSELMGFPWQRVGHLRRAAELGDMPRNLHEIEFNTPPNEARSHVFHLNRTFRNYIALCGFRSRLITWLGYESWFGRVVLHWVLYAIAGRPVKVREPNGREESICQKEVY